MSELNKNVPIPYPENVPIGGLGQSDHRHRGYTRSAEVLELAIQIVRKNSNHGLTFTDLLEHGLADSKRHAQRILKYLCHERKILFTLENRKPQRYFPTSMRAYIIENIKKNGRNVLLDPTGARYHTSPPSPFSKGPLSNCLQPAVYDYLDYVVLPLLQAVPPNIHNIHFKTKISRECYSEKAVQDLPCSRGNRGKKLSEVVGNAMILYTFYPSGTVVAQVACSKSPYKIETEIDHGRIIAFFGQIRDRLIMFLNDRHERIVPDLMEWHLTECDLNRDLKAGDWLQITGINIQVKHLDHLFRIYTKSMGRDWAGRVEEEKNPNRPPIEAINDLFNPCEKLERQLQAQDKILHQILDKLGQQNSHIDKRYP